MDQINKKIKELVRIMLIVALELWCQLSDLPFHLVRSVWCSIHVSTTLLLLLHHFFQHLRINRHQLSFASQFILKV